MHRGLGKETLSDWCNKKYLGTKIKKKVFARKLPSQWSEDITC